MPTDEMCDRLNALNASGAQPCLLVTISTGASQADFHTQVQKSMAWVIGAIATTLPEAGIPPTLVQKRAEDALVSLEGALMVSRELGDLSVFHRAIAQLPSRLAQAV